VAIIRHGDFVLELFWRRRCYPLADDRRYPTRDIRTMDQARGLYAVPDIEALMAELKAKAWMWPGTSWCTTATAVAFVRDNTGNLVEFVERPGPEEGRPSIGRHTCRPRDKEAPSRRKSARGLVSSGESD